MTENFPQAPGSWGDECWVMPPEQVAGTCVAPTDLDEILELPFQDELTAPMGGAAKFRDMLQDMPPVPPVERQAALDELMTAPAAPWVDSLATVWLIGSATLTVIAAVAAVIYLTVHQRRRTPSVEVSS